MFQKMYDFLLQHGMIVMVIGFIMAIVSLFVYMQTRYYGSAIPQVAFGCTIAGFGVYVLGRIFVAVGRRRSRTSGDTRSVSEDEE
jgi:uncharacterized membrane protein